MSKLFSNTICKDKISNAGIFFNKHDPQIFCKRTLNVCRVNSESYSCKQIKKRKWVAERLEKKCLM